MRGGLARTRLAAALLALLLVFAAAPGDGHGPRPHEVPVPAHPRDPREYDPDTGRRYTSEERFQHLPRDAQLRIAREVLKPLYARYPESFRHAEPFIEELPFLRVRLPNEDRAYDTLLKEEVRLRYERALQAELPLSEISVFAADFSNSPAIEAEAQAGFRRHIPARNRRLGRLLGELPGGRPDAAAIRAALAPFRGGVLILVGHVERDSRQMTLTRGGRRIEIDLDLWAQIAAEAGVGLIPYGCFSAEAGPIGSPHAVNSAQVARGIGAMLAARPASYGAMFGALTRERGLMLDLDPFEAALSFDRLDIVGPDGAEGEIWWNRQSPLYGPATASAEEARCANATDLQSYRQCLGAISDRRSAAEWEAGAPERAETAAYLLAEARRALTSAQRSRWLSIALFAASLLASALLIGLRTRTLAEAGAAPKPAWRTLLPRDVKGLAIPYGLALALALPGWDPATIAGTTIAILIGVLVIGGPLQALADDKLGEVARDWPVLLAMAIFSVAYLGLLGATPSVAEQRAGVERARHELDEACRRVPERLAGSLRACGRPAARHLPNGIR